MRWPKDAQGISRGGFGMFRVCLVCARAAAATECLDQIYTAGREVSWGEMMGRESMDHKRLSEKD